MKYPTPTLDAVVMNGREILLVPAESGWRLPGGPLRGGRGWLDCLKEMMEEGVGLRVRAARLTGVYSDPALCLVGDKHYLSGTFLVTETEGKMKKGTWFPANALPELSPAARIKIGDALAFDGTVVVR